MAAPTFTRDPGLLELGDKAEAAATPKEFTKMAETVALDQWSKYTEFFGCSGVDEFPIVEATSLVQFNMVSAAAVGPFAVTTPQFKKFTTLT